MLYEFSKSIMDFMSFWRDYRDEMDHKEIHINNMKSILIPFGKILKSV
jgi:hypothetical protein